MTWIKTIPEGAAIGPLETLYRAVKGPDGKVDNILKAHSLRPHHLKGHMELYKNVLHHPGNELPKWFLEYLGVWVSYLNHCTYCIEHHRAGMDRLVADPDRSQKLWNGITQGRFADQLDSAQVAAMDYAKTLTLQPRACRQTDIEEMQRHGFSDGMILEVNQVVAYFNYANRTVLGLGVEIDSETLGLSPNGEDWQHQ